MPRRKPKPERVVQEQIKASLDSILDDESLDVTINAGEGLPRIKSTESMDFSESIQTTGSDAKGLMSSIVKFYFDENLIDESDYIEYKTKIDSMNLASMLLQLKTAQHAITKLVEEIDLGNSSPRMFEVLSQLQSQIMQMPKDYQAYVDKMEEGYKKTQAQIEQKASSGSLQLESDKDGSGTFSQVRMNGDMVRVRGTKGLMEGLRDILGAEIEDAKVSEEEEPEVGSTAMVDARKKAAMVEDPGVTGDSQPLEIGDDLFNL